ncbi:MAG: GNAT family N-acetyltransferase [Novosphingobium sp.]
MSESILRPATSTDIPALAQLGRDSFVAKFAHLYRPADLAEFLEATHSDAAVTAEMANPERRYCVIEQDGALLAYAKLSLACGWPEYARGEKAIEIKQFYTAPGLSGQGIGARLMDWALGQARGHGADEIQLSVWSENFGAQKFYARYGFAKVADITFRVGEQLDAEFLFALMI